MKHLDRIQNILFLLLDFNVAFDSIDHLTLIKRLECDFVIIESALMWIKHYLADKRYSIILHKISTDPQHMVYPRERYNDDITHIIYII